MSAFLLLTDLASVANRHGGVFPRLDPVSSPHLFEDGACLVAEACTVSDLNHANILTTVILGAVFHDRPSKRCNLSSAKRKRFTIE
jgi:hypothetical protein